MQLGALTIERKARRIWLLVAVWTGVILWAGGAGGAADSTSHFILSFLRWLLPDATAFELHRLHSLIRKGAHVAEYGVLALFTLSALRASTRAATLRLVALTLAWVFAVAACDETRQAFVATRTGSPGDVALDLFGGVLALTLAIAYTRVMHSRRAPLERG
jgi:VanZ family protein